MKHRLLILFSFLLPTFCMAQDGYFSFSMKLPAEEAKILGTTLWEGLSQGKYLAFAGIDGTYSYTYGDVIEAFDGKIMKDEEVDEVVVSVYWNGPGDYLEPSLISPQYISNRNEVFYRMLDVEEGFGEEFLGRIYKSIGEEMLRYINTRQKTSQIVDQEMTTLQMIDFEDNDDLFIAPLGRIPGQLMEGLERGKYLAYHEKELSKALTFEDAKKTFYHYESVYPDLLEGLFVYESWTKEKYEHSKLKKWPAGRIRYNRKLDAIGFVDQEGHRIFFRWEDVRKFLGELGIWMKEYPRMTGENEEERSKVESEDVAAIYRLYFRSHFAKKLAVKLNDDPRYLKDRW